MASIHELDRLSRVLLDRLATEEARPPKAPATTLLGGMAKAGADLERFLKGVLVFAAEQAGRSPEDIIASSVGRPTSLRKVTLGQVAHGHRGKIGGGEKGVGADPIWSRFRGGLKMREAGREDPSWVLIVGEVGATSFPGTIAAFVHEVGRIKRAAQVAQPVTGPEELHVPSS